MIFTGVFGVAISVKEKQINIGVGKQPSATESAQSDQGEISRPALLGADDLTPEFESNPFYERGPLGKGCSAISGRKKPLTDSR